MSVRRTAAAALAAGLLLAGCSDDPEPRFEPTETPTPTESSSSAEPEAQSPEEFIREWFELNTEMQNTGETAAFLAKSPDCLSCRQLAKRVQGFYEAGGYVEIDSQRVVGVDPIAGNEFSVEVSSAPTRYKESADADDMTLKGGKAVYRMALHKTDGSWAMLNYWDTPR